MWLNNLECVGSETSLFSCPTHPIGVEKCNHDTGVICTEGIVPKLLLIVISSAGF